MARIFFIDLTVQSYRDYRAIWIFNTMSPFCVNVCFCVHLRVHVRVLVHVLVQVPLLTLSVLLSVSMSMSKWHYDYLCLTGQFSCLFQRPLQGGMVSERVSYLTGDG
jgi:hypothetical protein